MPHCIKTHSLVLPVLFVIAMVSSVVNTAPSPTFIKSSVSDCKELRCATSSSNGTPPGATSSGDDGLLNEHTEKQISDKSLPTKKGQSSDLNLSGNDQLTDIASLAANTELEMKVTTGDVLPVVLGTSDSKRIAKSTTDECLHEHAETRSTDLNQRAMCQWSYRMDIDDSRLPKEMEFAVLKCGGKCSDSSGNIVTDSKCEPVHYRTKVKRRVNNERWVDEYVLVPVAGVCVRNKV